MKIYRKANNKMYTIVRGKERLITPKDAYDAISLVVPTYKRQIELQEQVKQPVKPRRWWEVWRK